MPLPNRPRVVTAAAAVLLVCALLLAGTWAVAPERVISHGGQVFFIMLWTVLAYAAFAGLGWVRLAVAAILVAAFWGLFNTGIGTGLAAMSAADALARVLQLAALVLLCMPAANRWFAAVTSLRKDDA